MEYIYYPNSISEGEPGRMSCNRRLELQTRGSHPMMMPKNLPDHWSQMKRAVAFEKTTG